MDLKEVDVFGVGVGDYWYYVLKVSVICWFLGVLGVNWIFDVGVGFGFFLKYLFECM